MRERKRMGAGEGADWHAVGTCKLPSISILRKESLQPDHRCWIVELYQGNTNQCLAVGKDVRSRPSIRMVCMKV